MRGESATPPYTPTLDRFLRALDLLTEGIRRIKLPFQDMIRSRDDAFEDVFELRQGVPDPVGSLRGSGGCRGLGGSEGHSGWRDAGRSVPQEFDDFKRDQR